MKSGRAVHISGQIEKYSNVVSVKTAPLGPLHTGLSNCCYMPGIHPYTHGGLNVGTTQYSIQPQPAIDFDGEQAVGLDAAPVPLGRSKTP